jgi:GNAT superfamily N-acetyltransferase
MPVMAPSDPPDPSSLSVRTGWGADADAVAEVQVTAWRSEYSGLLPDDLLSGLDPSDLSEVWRRSISRPADARNRVLVALDGDRVRGFTVTGPGSDPDLDPVTDGEIGELLVHPDHLRQGHGSRLMHAAVDTLRADRFTRAVMWLSSTDDARRTFLTGSGWEVDGAHRELDLRGDGAVLVKQVRLHTSLA